MMGGMADAAKLAGVLEHREAAVVLQVLVQAHAVLGFAQDARQGRLAGLDGLAAQVRAVQFSRSKA